MEKEEEKATREVRRSKWDRVAFVLEAKQGQKDQTCGSDSSKSGQGVCRVKHKQLLKGYDTEEEGRT